MTTYGIDLGTTNSCIAYVDAAGRPVVLRSAAGEETTPSVVYFESADNVVVGRQARESVVLFPELVVELVKRQMGQDVRYTFNGQEYTPESISALILRELARAAGEQAREEVKDVVITVPAYFGVLERDATRKAGEIAGLNVLDVIQEPVAAALAYQSLGQETKEQRHLFVYDLGGGTFDTTVIRIDGDDITAVCTDGNHRLGGADWDDKLIEFLRVGFTEQHPDLDPSGDEQFMQDLAISAEQLKRALSSATSRKATVRYGGAVAQLELTRERYEELTSELLERTMEITARTLETARGKGIETYDDVLLVGGMTIMPAVARTLEERFGLHGRLQDPHLSVAKGAALFALIRRVEGSSVEEVADQLNMPAAQVADIARKHVATAVPRAFGVKVVDSEDPVFKTSPDQARRYIAHLLTANTALPADTEAETFRTIADNQREVKLEVWEQAGAVASEHLEHNTHIGEGILRDLPPRPAGAPFQVVFHMTETGLLQVHAWEPSSGREVRFEIQIGGLDQAAVREATDAIARLQVSG